MLKTFTPEDLLLFYYKETSPEETLMIKNSLISDPDLKKEYLEIRKMIGLLNKAEVRKPSQAAMNIIMNHSRMVRQN